MPIRSTFAACALGVVLSVLSAQAAPVPAPPRAVTADPAPDPAHPAANRQVLIPSHGDGMNALLMLAAGAGPKPTLLLLHGLPGNEQNLDVAQAARRAGWNVLTMHYRGSWGSPGRFSLAGAADDVDAAMAFLRDPAHARAWGIDTARLVVGGHSMGGFLAARYAARHADGDGSVIGAILIDPANWGQTGKAVLAHPEQRQDRIAAMGDDFGNALAGTDAAALMAEIERHARDWDLLDDAPRLAHVPVLLLGAERGNARGAAALADAVRARGAGDGALDARQKTASNLDFRTMPTDHAFIDHRIALATAIVDWLDARRQAAATHSGRINLDAPAPSIR